MRREGKTAWRCMPWMLCSAIVIVFAHGLQAQSGDDTPVLLTDFRHPEYGEHSSDIPEMMIYGARAKTVGIMTHLEELRLEWFDGALDKVKATITTPTGIYDRSTKIIKGDDAINMKSDKMTVDGVGFVADSQKKTIQVLSNVRVVLTGDLDSEEKKKPQKENN